MAAPLRSILLLAAALPALGACSAVAVATSVVGAGVSVASTAVGAGVSVATTAVDAAVAVGKGVANAGGDKP